MRSTRIVPVAAVSAALLFALSTVAAVIVPRPAAHHQALAARTAPIPAVVDVYRHQWALSPSAEVEPTTTTSLPSVPVTSVPVAAHPAEPRPRSRVRAMAGAPQPSAGGYEACVIYRESRGSATAQNPRSSSSGLYGFLSSTFDAVTGLSGPARDYPPAVQRAAFLKLYAAAGRSPWSGDGC